MRLRALSATKTAPLAFTARAEGAERVPAGMARVRVLAPLAPKAKSVGSVEAASRAALLVEAAAPAAPNSSTEAGPAVELAQLTQALIEKGGLAAPLPAVFRERSLIASVGAMEKGEEKCEPATSASAVPSTPVTFAINETPCGCSTSSAEPDSYAEPERKKAVSEGSPAKETGGRQPSTADTSVAPGTQRAHALAPPSAYSDEDARQALQLCAPSGAADPSLHSTQE